MLRPNPVLLKELRSRMRGARAFVILTVFLLLLSGFSALLYQIATAVVRDGPGPAGAVIGQSLFGGLMMFELLLILFVTPALTAGALSREHEAQTFEMLVATPLRPASIVAGKLLAALSYVFLLIVAAVPFGSVFFLFGGVTVRDLVIALALLAAIALTFGTVGLFWSALLRKTGRATVATYLTVAAFMLLPYFFYIAQGILQQREPPRVWLIASPFSALGSALASSASASDGPGILFFVIGFGARAFDQGLAESLRPTWHFTLWLYGLMAALAFLGAVYRTRPIRRSINRRDVAVVTGTLALFLLVAVLAFGGGDWGELLRTGAQP